MVLKNNRLPCLSRHKKELIVIQNFSIFSCLLRILSISALMVLAACGGGSPTDVGGNGAANTAQFASHIGTESWTYCADEGGVCTFSGTRQVRYGVEGAYTYKTATTSAACTNEFFGDPAVGADKNCAYSNSEVPVASESWTFCAGEGEVCTFSGTRQVEYGADGHRFWRTATNSIACTNEVFGDPIVGTYKTCNVSSWQAEPTSEEPPPVTWTHCANEGGTCTFTGTREVRYGLDGTYAYRTETDSVACTNDVFGDPLPGADKVCEYSSESSTEEPPPPPPPSTEVLPIPTGISDGATVNLQCGRTYQGTLELNGKSNITVRTEGTCGKASITPGSAISGWTLYQGSIYSAPIGFTPVQVAVAGSPVDAAHWPNRPQIWAAPGSSVPNSDLDGATRVYLENQSVIQTERISGNSVDTSKPYYVEGKFWMLDSPGEWAVDNGRLYLWAPDGQSPEGRVWAAPESNGVNADYSSNITIDGIKIFSAYDGVSGNTSSNLRVLNTDISNSARDGIWASGSNGLTVAGTTVTNSVRNGIDGWYSVVGAVVEDSTVTNTGTFGRPKPSDAGIMFGDGANNRISNVRVINSGYHGISVLHNHNTSVTNSTVDRVCVRLTDCGGIYTAARDRHSLDLRIEGNIVTNVRGTELVEPYQSEAGIAIYLDDFANGVTVTGNNMSNSTRGMVVHNGFNNEITHNTFKSNNVTHLQFAQDYDGTIRNNNVTYNTFESTNDEQTYNLEVGPDLREFGIFNHNTYISTNPGIFARTWDGVEGVTRSYSDWKSWMGQDANSTMNGSP
jgi:parallel beta-helix repeat protein